MSIAASMLAENVLNVCCGGVGANLFGKKPTSTEAPSGKTQEAKIDPKFKRNFLNQEMKFELTVWKKLPPKARKACEELGYDKDKWDNSEAVDVTDKSWWDLSDSEKANLEILGWEETAWEYQYQDTEWSALPELQKKAAKIAGYDEDSWEEDWVESLDKMWDELGKDQKEAVSVMGWTRAEWDEEN